MCFIDCLNNAPMNENDVVNIMTMCKDYLKQSHSLMLVNLPYVNSEVKEIIDVLNRIERQSDNDIDNQVANNLSSTFDDVSTENTNPSVSDENEVANILLNINDIASDAENFPNPNDKKEYTDKVNANSLSMGTCAAIVSCIIFYVLFHTIDKRR